MPDLKVLLSRETIAKRVAEMGAEIARDFRGQSIIFVGVLKGAAIFLSDLARQVHSTPPSTLSGFQVTETVPLPKKIRRVTPLGIPSERCV